MKDLLQEAARRAETYLAGLDQRAVTPTAEAMERLARLDKPLPAEPSDPAEVLALLDSLGSPATVASAGGRYFGFVTGGALPAALAANWLAGVWDQNSALTVMSPIAAKVEEVALRWLLEVLALPPDAGAGFVTGATMANFTALAAARFIWRSRDYPPGDCRGASRRYLLVRRRRLAGPDRHAHQRLFLGHYGRRCRAQPGRYSAGSAEVGRVGEIS